MNVMILLPSAVGFSELVMPYLLSGPLTFVTLVERLRFAWSYNLSKSLRLSLGLPVRPTSIALLPLSRVCRHCQ